MLLYIISSLKKHSIYMYLKIQFTTQKLIFNLSI